MYTTYIDNVGRNILIFDYSSGLAGFADFVLKLSKHEVEVEDEVLSYSNIDSNIVLQRKLCTSMPYIALSFLFDAQISSLFVLFKFLFST